MLFFVCTAVLAAIILGVKYTRDIFIKPLKAWLCKFAVLNWMESQPQKFGKPINVDPKTYAETGLLPDEQDIAAERPVSLNNPALRDEYIIYGTDEKGNGLSVKIIRFPNNETHADVLITSQDVTYSVSSKGETPSAFDFSLGNLKMEMVEPFRIWRIWYNGLMTRSSSQNKEGKLVHVVYNFLWKALARPVDNRKNGNANLLANHLCSSQRFGENLPSLLKIVPEGFSQMGTLHGSVNINDSHHDDSSDVQHQLYLYGFRTREIISSIGFTKMLDAFPVLGKSTASKECLLQDDARRLELFAICDDGDGFRLTAVNDIWTDGRMLWSSYATSLVTDIDCTPIQLLNDRTFPKLFNISDGKRTSKVEIWPAVKTLQLSNKSQIAYLKLTVNGQNANGVLIRKTDVVETSEEICNTCIERDNDWTTSILQNPTIKRTTHTCKQIGERNSCQQDGENYDYDTDTLKFTEFSHPSCRKVVLVGGKGASLAKLHTFTLTHPSSQVKTARGFCITTTLFRELLELEKFTDIFSTAASNQSLQDACSLVMKEIKSSDAEKRISTLISQRIETIFGKENRNKIRFAVRSSGVLEDGTELSCAGQNETFLGVSEELVPRKVVECWASLFTVQSVGYRLNHGQPAVSEMGVVIQEMVDATAAGVIFTADPRTGNPFQMIITANYGLGESVVSGSCDPDTIILNRLGKQGSGTNSGGKKCTEKLENEFIMTPTNNKWWTDVTVKEKVLGEKKIKIVCTPVKVEQGKDAGSQEQSTQEISMTNQESQKFCLDEETAIKLGNVAAEIEIFMGHHKPVDIEWAIDQSGQIFILQCRTLTALDAWSDFEILHELDTAIRTKQDRFTIANTGEVLPKALHALGVMMNRCLEFCIQTQVYLRKGDLNLVIPYTNISCPLFQQRLHINMFQTMYSSVEKEITTASICLDQTLFGRQVIDEEIREAAAKRFGVISGFSKLKDMKMTIQMLRSFKSVLEKADNEYKNFKFDYSELPRNSKSIYQQISKDLITLYDIAQIHLFTTQSSSASQLFVFLFLSEGKKPSEWDSSIFEDASKLLSVFANVESADMPEDMDMLGDQIIRHGGELKHIIEDFLEVSPHKALEWLRGNEKVNQALDDFFEKHGHRGIAEMDLGEPSWRGAPLSFLPILRNMLKNKIQQQTGNDNFVKTKTKSTCKNDDELLNSLSSTLKPMTRRLLKFILPTCRSAVICREKSKSLFVRVIDQFKEQYQFLAKLMVEQHLLPSESLIVHLTHFEIGLLVNKDVSSSTILQKAMKRHKMYPLMEKLEFPEISIGIPHQVDSSIPVTVTETIQATPVSRGVAKGVAKVCLSVEEASELLEPGDILITHGTDIAWSPFFPILGGVVTELGGLISHGAVVAREYGLPCIVGAVNATKIFKTGEKVILDAGKGTLSKTQE